MGGVQSQVVYEVTVEALPMAVPDRLEIDSPHSRSATAFDSVAGPRTGEVLDDP